MHLNSTSYLIDACERRWMKDERRRREIGRLCETWWPDHSDILRRAVLVYLYIL